MEALRAGYLTPNESGLPGVHGLIRGFIPRQIRASEGFILGGAVETAPHSMEALRATHTTPNESGLPDFHA